MAHGEQSRAIGSAKPMARAASGAGKTLTFLRSLKGADFDYPQDVQQFIGCTTVGSEGSETLRKE